MSGATPVIGITTYVEPARWGAWELEAALIPEVACVDVPPLT